MTAESKATFHLPFVAAPGTETSPPRKTSTAILGQIVVPPEVLAPVLQVVAGGDPGAVHRIDRTPFVVGRGEDCDLRVDDQGVSWHHCAVILHGTEVVVKDLGSTNGTWRNYERIERAPLHEGDRIRLGRKTVLRFTRQDEDEEASQRGLYEAAVRDALTGIYNKRYFHDHVCSELAFALRHGTSVGMLLIDIDHFKRVNDTWGHPAGDAVLTRLAALLGASCRAEDVVARVGGEEFAALARGLTLEQLEQFAERVRQLVESTTFTDRDQVIPVTISIGAALLEGPAATLGYDALFRRADKALYDSKHSGRNRVTSTVISLHTPPSP